MEVGRRVLQGILHNDLYILTHPEYEPGLRERFEALLASMPVEQSPSAARVAAEAVVLRNPLYAQERDRRLLARAAAQHAARQAGEVRRGAERVPRAAATGARKPHKSAPARTAAAATAAARRRAPGSSRSSRRTPRGTRAPKRP